MGQLMKLLHFRSATLQNGARSETRTHKPGAGTRSLVWRVFQFRHSCIWCALRGSNPRPSD